MVYISSNGNFFAYEDEYERVTYIKNLNNKIMFQYDGLLLTCSPDRTRLLINTDSICFYTGKVLESFEDVRVVLGNNVNFLFRDNSILLDNKKILELEDNYNIKIDINNRIIIILNDAVKIYNHENFNYYIEYSFNNNYEDYFITSICNNYIFTCLDESILLHNLNTNRITNIIINSLIYWMEYYNNELAVLTNENLLIININTYKSRSINLKKDYVLVSLENNLLITETYDAETLFKDDITSPILASIIKKDRSPLSNLTLDAFTLIYKKI